MVDLDKSNIFAPPQTTAAPFQNNAQAVEFFTVAHKKMMIMSIGTLGFYVVYWFFRQWQAQKIAHNLSVMPRMRAVFSIFFTHALLRRVHETATAQGIDGGFQNHKSLATTFVALYVLSSVLSNIANRISGFMAGILFVGYIAAFIYSFMPLFATQKVINQLNRDPSGSSNQEITGANIAWLVLGGLTWLVILFGAFALVMGIDS